MSNKKQEDVIEYNEDTQKLLLEYMISDPESFVISQNIIDASYWNSKLRSTCKYIMEYSDEYRTVPSNELIKAKTGVQLEQVSQDKIINHREWYLKTIEEFCRHKAMENLVYEGPDLVSQGHYSELERRSKENMLITLSKDMGTDYFTDPLARLQRMRDRTDTTSTGWKDIDQKLYGGMNRGEVTFFAGGPGTGKSLFLQNLSLNWVQMGLNVVYITLELSEELIGLRFDAMITDTETKSIFKDMEGTALKVAMSYKRNNWGKLSIKKFPGAGTNCNSIRAYIKEYQINNGFLPDAICVDYLDLLHPNNSKIDPSNLFIKDKYTSEELRSLAGEYNMLCASASQLGRSSIQEADLDQSHIAGGISKINTADNVLAIFISPQMKEAGQYQIQFLKTPSSNGVGSRVGLSFSQLSLRIMDATEDGPKASSMSSIVSELAKTRTSKRSEEDDKPEANKGSAGAGLRERMGLRNKSGLAD